MVTRCEWAETNALEKDYHDHEWGVPVHEDKKLFELLVLESMQAGLSWSTILAKRSTLKEAYDDFDYNIICKYTEEKINNLLTDPGVIRNKLKIKSTISNAQSFIKIKSEFGSFDSYIWSFVDNTPQLNSWHSQDEVPASTDLSDLISKELKKRGFKFLGTTSIYAFMQSIGMVNDHVNNCFRKKVY
ncbi:DNA-3-methyladenine glycosylase I [Enterococcus entomosocium]|uniref:DNA-3-methyladenine glycosylase I n=1 Tax=Enterococcus entomosocium TaxID=3034352 RepID=UPI003D6B688B